jgi:DNA-binding transcriptional ArsR family regulator
MARAATTTDVFNAIAEPRRREIIGVLNDGREWAVNDVVVRVRMAQPAVSKHLGVLRKVGVVTVVKRGQHRMYRLNAAQLKPVHDWVKTFERYWTHQLSQIKERAERKALERMISTDGISTGGISKDRNSDDRISNPKKAKEE